MRTIFLHLLSALLLSLWGCKTYEGARASNSHLDNRVIFPMDKTSSYQNRHQHPVSTYPRKPLPQPNAKVINQNPSFIPPAEGYFIGDTTPAMAKR